jgi:putative hydrolase of HD superfamily
MNGEIAFNSGRSLQGLPEDDEITPSTHFRYSDTGGIRDDWLGAGAKAHNRKRELSLSLPPFAEFILRLDGLKLVERRTYINRGERLENSAEHSWHVAVAAWALANYLNREVSIGKLLQLAVIHDLGELDAGDTFLYSADRNAGVQKEKACVSRIANEHRDLIPDLEVLWDEQEAGATNEARLLKIADRLLPFLHNLASEGKTWKQNSIARSQVLDMHAFIESEAPELFGWMKEQLDMAVDSGWLIDG